MDSINISIPDNFVPERSYLVYVIFEEFLGLKPRIVIDHTLSAEYVIGRDEKKIVFNDHFFSAVDPSHGYLFDEFVPKKVFFVSNGFLPDSSVPVLYGIDKLETSGNEIRCGYDIFSCVFYMLTRWEEMVIKERDSLDRFPAQSSLAFKNGFLQRPVVNEWIAMLQKMLLHLFPSLTFKPSQSFHINFTHDIDFLNSPVSLREFAKDVLKRRSIAAFYRRFTYLMKGENPYDLFDYFMNISERNSSLSRFYFMTGHNLIGRDGENYNSTPFYQKTLRHIKERGHVIGFHPSLLTYKDPIRFSREKAQLEADTGQSIIEGRQHALRFEMPSTWQMWDHNGLLIDSTMGYSAHEGFRCGTGNLFTVFDVINRKPLRLKEMPLVIMDTTLHVNRKLSIEQSAEIITGYINKGRKYNMPITLLFHNLIDESIDWGSWRRLYHDLFFN
jgi:hypothetical protein